MGEFFSNVFRYPKYLITIILGIFTAFLQPLIRRSQNPITAIALIGAFISAIITFYFVVKAMVLPQELI